MISIKDLSYGLMMKLNNLASNKHQDIEVKNRIDALNQAQLQFVKKRYNLNNIYKNAFDSGIKRYEELEFLVTPYKKMALKKAKHSEQYFAYEVELDKKNRDYLFYVDSYIKADSGNCKGMVIQNRLVRHSDLPIFYKNKHYTPSFEYQETLSVISDNKLIITTDGKFIPTELHLSYIRYPKKVDQVGYIHFDGSSSTDIDSEFPYSAMDEILNLAVMELSLDTTIVTGKQIGRAHV